MSPEAAGAFGDFERSVFARRRAALAARLPSSAIGLHAGEAPSRNYPENRHPFRASSHFLHLVGLPIEGAVLVLREGEAVLHVPAHDDTHALFHGAPPRPEALAETLGLRVVVGDAAPAAATYLPSFDLRVLAKQRDAFGVTEPEAEEQLRDALIAERLRHDELAVRELRTAARTTAMAHVVGMAACRPGVRAASVRAAIGAVFTARSMQVAYEPIVTSRGDVLHATSSDERLRASDFLLVDAGCESPFGYAADVTRTYPVSGRFEPAARDLYLAVLEAQRTCVERCVPGTRYRDVHFAACLSLAESLRSLGLLLGDPAERAVDGSVATFLPHGVGHLLGLDVHDLEDLGDTAGYAHGRTRSTDAGLRYLRLDRDLEAGMAVTIEPGLYFLDALLDDPQYRSRFAGRIDFTEADRVRHVRGIRIEDDVLVHATGPEVMTAAAPKAVEGLEAVVGSGVDWASALDAE